MNVKNDGWKIRNKYMTRLIVIEKNSDIFFFLEKKKKKL